MIRGGKQYIDELVCIFKVFSAAFGMEINWKKHVHIGLIITHIDQSGWHATIGGG